MPQLLKRWEAATFHLFGQEIRVEIKAPSFAEEPEFNRRMVEFGTRAKPARDALVALQEGKSLPSESYEALFSTIDPKWAAGIFERCLRLPEPIALEGEEGSGITTGSGLLEIANGAFVMDVLNKVAEMSRLGTAEGKVSSSPSMSESAGTIGAGASPATSTGSGDGPEA